jgi:hypothetical protein
MRKLEQILKTNFDTVRNANNALFVTLTYAELQFDADKVMADFKKFIKRLKYMYSTHKLDYVVVVEPHASGAWHLHMCIKSDQPKLFIDNNEVMEPTWGHGFTKTVRLKSDDCGRYYTAYFSNVEAPIGETKPEIQEAINHNLDIDPADLKPDKSAKYAFSKDEKGNQKRFQKGDRLRFYPKHMKFYRCSRDIIRPEPQSIPSGFIPKDLGKPVKISTYSITATDKHTNKITGKVTNYDKHINLIQREIYKRRVKPVAVKKSPRRQKNG